MKNEEEDLSILYGRGSKLNAMKRIYDTKEVEVEIKKSNNINYKKVNIKSEKEYDPKKPLIFITQSNFLILNKR
jgi:hypothetical protein